MDQIGRARRWRGYLMAPMIGIVGAALLVAYLLWFGYRESLDAARTHTRNLAAVLETRLSSSLARTRASLDELSAMLVAPGNRGLEFGTAGMAAVIGHLNLELRNFPEVRAFHVFDARGGYLFGTSGSIDESVSIADRPHFQRLRQDPVADLAYSDVIVARHGGVETVALVRALRNEHGAFIGVVSAILDLDYFVRMLGAVDVGPRGVIALRRSDDFKLVLRQPPMAEQINRALPEDHVVRRTVSSGAREGSLEANAQADGILRIFAFRRLEADPYFVLVGLARDDALAGWRVRAGGTGLAGLLLLLVLGLQLRHVAAVRRQEARARQRQADGEQRLRLNEARLTEAMDMAGMACWEYDLGTARGRLDDRFYALHHARAADLGGYEPTLEEYSRQFLDMEDAARLQARFEACAAAADPTRVFNDCLRVRCPDGASLRLETDFRYVPANGHGGARITGVVMDVTERRLAEERLRLLAEVFEHSGEAILVTDVDNRIVSVNRAFTRLTGYELADVQGENPRVLSAGRTSLEEYQAMWRAIREQGGWQGEIWDQRRDGSCYPKLLTISTLRDGQGQVTHHIGSFTDISARKAAEQQIQHMAHHDALTGLPNRFNLHHRLEQAVAGARRDCLQVAVMFIDLDHFKKINDTLGHPVGDALLIQVARQLRGCVRESDVVARLGGDEFVVAMIDIADAALQSVPAMARKITRQLSMPYRIAGQELHVTPSIGIAVFPADGGDVDTLMKNADTAMYHAKAQGRHNFQFFTAAMNKAAAERLQLEGALRQAIERGEFVLHFQPQISLADRRVSGVEALVRWQHPELGLLAPGRFISLAEETGLIEPLGEWVLDEACRQLRALHDRGHRDLRMAVNLSGHQLRQGNLPARLQWLAKAYDFRPGDLELEITESITMETPELTVAMLRQFRELGVVLAIDDFGTGYSSLSRLKLLPIQRIKLDRSFVRDIETDPNDAAICKATIAMAHSLGLDLVAEGVETAAQLEYLRELGCDHIQGFYFSRPLPAVELLAFLESFQVGATV